MNDVATYSAPNGSKPVPAAMLERVQRPRLALAGLQAHPSEAHAVTAIHLRINRPLPVNVLRDGGNVDMRADWARINWERYEAIVHGLRKIVAAHISLSVEEVSVTKSLYARDRLVTPRFSLEVPSTHEELLASADLENEIQRFLSRLLGEGTLQLGHENRVVSRPGLMELESPTVAPTGLPTEDRARHIEEVVQETRTIVGGCTLREACFVESPAWENRFKLEGKIAPKPRSENLVRERVTMECRVDGFVKSQRVVHLLRVQGSLSRMDVAFDETKWLGRVVKFASLNGQRFEVTYDEVREGTKVNRTLVDLKPAGDELFAAAQ